MKINRYMLYHWDRQIFVLSAKGLPQRSQAGLLRIIMVTVISIDRGKDVWMSSMWMCLLPMLFQTLVIPRHGILPVFFHIMEHRLIFIIMAMRHLNSGITFRQGV